ncbi:MAG: ABC transporter permease, partial [Collinsella sp.]|nr:ABC transporter permease [Collinsella sp.]
MSFRDLMREAFRALEANRGRSLLTVLGIVIGISAVIAMTSLIGGAQQALLSGLGLNAARMIQVNASSLIRGSDIDKVEKLVRSLELIEGTADGGADIKVDGRDVHVSITGASSQLLEKTGRIHLGEGRLFNAEEEASGGRVALIERGGIKTYFGDPNADVIGKQIKLGNNSYTIIGIADSPARSAGDDTYMTLYMPRKTVERNFSWLPEDSYWQVTVLVNEGYDVDVASAEIKAALAKAKGISEDEIEDNIWTFSMKAQIDQLNSFTMTFQLITGSVAGISLLVGGIG